MLLQLPQHWQLAPHPQIPFFPIQSARSNQLLFQPITLAAPWRQPPLTLRNKLLHLRTAPLKTIPEELISILNQPLAVPSCVMQPMSSAVAIEHRNLSMPHYKSLQLSIIHNPSHISSAPSYSLCY